MSRTSARRLAVVALTLVIAACGDFGSPTTTTVPTTPPSTTPGTVPDTTTPSSTTTSRLTSTQTLEVYFATSDGTDCSEVTGFAREVDATLDPISTAFGLLVAGPTVEEMAEGAGSVFADDSSGAIGTVSLYDELLIIDFRDIRSMLSNASTSCGSESLLAQLNSTAFQFGAVGRVRYEIDGSCDVFSNWLQRGCMEYTREGAEPADLSTNERALGSGCIPGSDGLPDGRWFGYVEDADEGQLLFDLACWFSGSAAADAAREDGEESPPPNDYYVRNVSDVLRVVPVDPNSEVSWLPTGDPADVATISYADWVAGRGTRTYLPGVWLEVVQGVVVAIEEQYIP